MNQWSDKLKFGLVKKLVKNTWGINVSNKNIY